MRAYDVGSVGGALGGVGSAELRHHLGVALPGDWQAMAFIDSGIVRVYKNAFAAGENRATLSGAGVGLNWVGPKGWTVTAAVAAAIGENPALVGATAGSRVWVEIRKAFIAQAPTTSQR